MRVYETRVHVYIACHVPDRGTQPLFCTTLRRLSELANVCRPGAGHAQPVYRPPSLRCRLATESRHSVAAQTVRAEYLPIPRPFYTKQGRN